MIQSPGRKSLNLKLLFIKCNLLSLLYCFYYNEPPLLSINLDIRFIAL